MYSNKVSGNISYFLKKNRIEYYDRMTEVRRTGSYEQWVKFFLEAVYESAADATETIDKLTVLHDKNTEIIKGFGRSADSTMKLFSYLEENSIIVIQNRQCSRMAFNTVSSAVGRLCDAGILVQSSGEIRRRTFSYEAYLDLLQEASTQTIKRTKLSLVYRYKYQLLYL